MYVSKIYCNWRKILSAYNIIFLLSDAIYVKLSEVVKSHSNKLPYITCVHFLKYADIYSKISNALDIPIGYNSLPCMFTFTGILYACLQSCVKQGTTDIIYFYFLLFFLRYYRKAREEVFLMNHHDQVNEVVSL